MQIFMPRDIKAFHRLSFLNSVKQSPNRIYTWYLNAASYRRTWVSSSGMLWPTALILLTFVLIQNVGQLRSLGSALAAAMHGYDGYYDGGFAAGVCDLLIWWACCWLALLACATFSSTKEEAQNKQIKNENRAVRTDLSLHLLSALLVLSPLFAGGLDVWRPEVLVSIATISLLTTWAARLGKYYFLSFVICIAVSIVANHHELWSLGAVSATAWGLAFIFHPRWRKRKWSMLAVGVVCMITANVAIVGPIFANSLLARQDPQHISWNGRALLLAAWWLLPALLVWSTKIVRSRFTGRQINFLTIVLVLVVFVVAAIWPTLVFGLNTLCLFLTGLLSVGNLMRTSRVGLIRRVMIYSYLVAGVLAANELTSAPDFSNYDAPLATGQFRSSSFFEYYEKWLKARGETPRDHGPLVLVAVAGGGVRAAAHASVALSLADDSTAGKFGERTLMISAVSGGSLGAATWLAQRVDGLPPADPARIRSGGASPRGLALSRFYRNDFLSPVVNRMLLHDLPLAALPKFIGYSDRDTVLKDTWQTAWQNLLSEENVLHKKGQFFEREMGALSNDGSLPLIVFNTTSATDGRSATYSSYPGAVRWSWQLDPHATVGRAVLDSARFAAISPVGVACAQDGAFDIPRMLTPPINCKPGFRPLAVADGGYRDNSGLAEIAVVIDELARYGDTLDKVFVVQITSNPDEGIRQVEGTRFDNGRLLSELLSPAIVQESARGGHSEAYQHQIMGHRYQPHMLTWGLSHYIEAENLSLQREENRWRFAWLNKRAHQADLERQLRLPPLGWTIDPQSYWRLYGDSLRIPEMPSIVKCGDLLPQYSTLCKALETANSVVPQPAQ